MRVSLLTILTLFSIGLFAQEEVGDLIPLAEVPESVALTSFANQYASAVQNNDYTKVAELTHTDIIKMGGGVDFIISDLKSEGDMLKQQGFVYTGTEVGNHPEFLTHQKEMQTVIPVKYFLEFGGKKVEAWTNLYACSADEGKTWSFVNLEKFDESSLKEFVSNVSPQFVFPVR